MSNIRKIIRSIWVPVILIGMTGIPASAQTDASPVRTGLLQAIEAEISDLLANNRRCVFRIHTIYGPAEDRRSLGYGNAYTHGTGFLIDNAGHVLTVDKAVKGASEIRVTMADGGVSDATFVASDPTSDVAVIRVKGDHSDHIAFGNSDNVRIGHYSFILGNAFDQLLPSIGSVYEVNRDEDLIQIASAVHPSYGGAPVFNSSGQVIGMVWAAPLLAQGNAALGGVSELPTSVFVIPINRAKRIASTLIAQVEMAYGWLGVEVDRETHPVVVTDVAEDGPAWRSGIRPGDRIIAYNGKPVAGPFHLERLVMETPPGQGVPIRVKRESITVITEALVTGRKATSGENPYGQLLWMDDGFAADPGSVEGELFEQIQTLEREIGRLRALMEQK
jgi:S1-C subfamily serine protease